MSATITADTASLTFTEIPLISAAQTLSTSLLGVLYNLNIYWNKPSQCWILDISDANQNPLISGIPLVTGVGLLDQYEYAMIGGNLMIASDIGADVPPTFYNLGAQTHLLFVTSNA